jgi:predicted MPP superfamily phosphohydrolase
MLRMLITLVQLSDMHFEKQGNWLSGKAENVANAIWALDPTTRHFFLLFCGDIAYSGAELEYQAAKSFIEDLRKSLRDRNSNPTVDSAFARVV